MNKDEKLAKRKVILLVIMTLVPKVKSILHSVTQLPYKIIALDFDGISSYNIAIFLSCVTVMADNDILQLFTA